MTEKEQNQLKPGWLLRYHVDVFYLVVAVNEHSANLISVNQRKQPIQNTQWSRVHGVQLPVSYTLRHCERIA